MKTDVEVAMAKIYETHADAERERLHNEIKEQTTSKRAAWSSALGLSALSLSAFSVDTLEQFKANVEKTQRTWLSRLNKPLGYLTGIAAGLSIVDVFKANKKIKQDTQAFEAAGPQEIVLPSDFQLSDLDVIPAHEGAHVGMLKKNTSATPEKSL